MSGLDYLLRLSRERRLPELYRRRSMIFDVVQNKKTRPTAENITETEEPSCLIENWPFLWRSQQETLPISFGRCWNTGSKDRDTCLNTHTHEVQAKHWKSTSVTYIYVCMFVCVHTDMMHSLRLIHFIFISVCRISPLWFYSLTGVCYLRTCRNKSR